MVVVHVAMPATPVIAQMPVATGVTAFAGPVTVAVNAIVEPRVAVGNVVATTTVGVTPVTTVDVPDVGATL